MIHELVSGRLADKTKQLEALDHAGHCLWCARRLDEESKLTERLRAFASSLQGQHAPLRLEVELLQAFRERKLGEGTPLLGRAWRRIWRGAAWGLAFAAMVTTAWIMVIEWPRLHRATSVVPSQASTNRPQVSPDASRANVPTGSGETGATLKSDARAEVAHIRNSQRSVPEESASEATTDFISLGTCDDSQCMEEATLVRVALPAEALLAFGLGTDNEYAPDALVQADVALGSNGVPFAIRFVN
jgi:hypothetical protein